MDAFTVTVPADLPVTVTVSPVVAERDAFPAVTVHLMSEGE